MWPNNGYGNGQTPDEFFDPSVIPPFPIFQTQEGYFPHIMNNVPSPEAAQLGFAQNQTQGSFMQNQNLPVVQVSLWIGDTTFAGSYHATNSLLVSPWSMKANASVPWL